MLGFVNGIILSISYPTDWSNGKQPYKTTLELLSELLKNEELIFFIVFDQSLRPLSIISLALWTKSDEFIIPEWKRILNSLKLVISVLPSSWYASSNAAHFAADCVKEPDMVDAETAR